MHNFRWLLYVLRLAFYLLFGVLRFISKPGLRILVPISLALLAFLLRPSLDNALADEVRRLIDPGYQPEGYLLDTALVISVLVLALGYVLSSRMLGAIIGAFPVPMRPLPPIRKLKPTKTEIASVPVRIVVPPLPRR